MDKVHLNVSMEFWLKAAMQKLSEKKGIPISQIIQETMCEKYPDFMEYKTKVVRRIV